MTTHAHYTCRRARLAVTAVALAAMLAMASTTLPAATGCSSPDPAARIDPRGPDRGQFAVVAPMLVRRCGSIDCHGSIYRNFRLYGYAGTRLRDGQAPETLRPDLPKRLTDEEIEADYQAVLGVEPEIMRDVVNDNGNGRERLTLVRKGRGEEDHKGDQRMVPDDEADTCLGSWLAGAVNVEKCRAAGCIDPDSGLIEGAGCTAQ
jgi:hypothetical protein